MNYLFALYINLFESLSLPKFLAVITFPVIPFIVVAIALILIVLVLVLMERKVLALLTQRKGPNRVGFWGLLQTVADAIKLLCKENIEPKGVDNILFTLAPLIAFTPVMICWGILPYSTEFDFMSFSTSALLFSVVALIPLIAYFLTGFASNNKYSLIGAMRTIATAISYELPMMFSLLSIAVLAQSLNLKDIILAQTSIFPFCGWFIFPCLFGFIIMLISIIAELNRCPFDLSEAESELVGGYNTEYSGMRFALFFLGEYAMLFASSAFLVALFFGGFLSPLGFYISEKIFTDNVVAQFFVYFEQAFWFILKTFVMVFIIMWVRATLPRLNTSNLLKFSWYILLPASILNFLYICVFKHLTLAWGCV